MTKYQFAIEHFWANVRGAIKHGTRHPIKYSRLLTKRAEFFRNRTFTGPVDALEPFAPPIRTMQEMISYWEIMVEDALSGNWCEWLSGKRNPVVVDVGANRGVFCRLIRRINQGANIIAFEPNTELKRDSNLDLLADSVHWVGLSDQSGSVPLHVKGECGFIRTGFSDSIDHQSTCTLATLDSFNIPSVHLLKIDVDGHALECLNGAKRTLSVTHKVLIELDPKEKVHECAKLLREFSDWKQIDQHNYLFSRP